MKNETIEHIEEKINNIIKTINNKEEWTQKKKRDTEVNDIYHFISFKKDSNMGRYGLYPLDFDKTKMKFQITKETKLFIEFIKQT